MAVTPSAPVTVFGLVSVRARGHTVDTILFAMVAMVLTAISYGRMAALYPSAGSAYTYVGRGLNPHLGFLAGWAMLLDYLIIPLFCVVYGSLIVQRMLPQVPYVIIAAGFAGGITYLNVRGIRATARANEVLMCLWGSCCWRSSGLPSAICCSHARLGRSVLHPSFLRSARVRSAGGNSRHLLRGPHLHRIRFSNHARRRRS